MHKLIHSISVLSTKDRNELISTEVLDQPRSIRVHVDQLNHIHMLEYFVKLVNGHFMMKFSVSTTPFCVHSVLSLIKKVRSQNYKVKLCFSIDEKYNYKLKLPESDKECLGWIQTKAKEFGFLEGYPQF